MNTRHHGREAEKIRFAREGEISTRFTSIVAGGFGMLVIH